MKSEEDRKSELSNLVSLSKNVDNDNKIKEALKSIISDGINFNVDVVNPITLILDDKNAEIKCLAAQAVAELCKCEKKRISYAQNEIVEKILNNLNQSLILENMELIKQSCRALGNICFESYVGRDLVLNLDGIPKIVNILPQTLHHDKDKELQFSTVRLNTCKLLLILMLGGSEYIKPALDADFLNKIHQVIKYEFSSQFGDDDRLHTTLSIMSVVAEYSRSLIIDENITLLVVEILKTVKNMEISEVCLEYLHYQAESDEVKTTLAKAAVPQILWSLLQKYRVLAVDEESRELMKLACDLIALILTGDTSMDLLYADGKGEFYLSMIDSLRSEDIELSITAILAIGNFARTDTHCIHMMETGVFSKLMSILALHKNQEDDIRLQHVVLSGLRNLVIPQKNKSRAVEHGILPLLIEMIPNVTQYHVVFKLLATLRMLVDGQESVAEDLVSSNILDRVAKWGTQAEHSGVSGEASRLLARIIRQLQSKSYIVKLVEVTGCVSCLINMLGATHAIMQNEAIVSLTILCCTCLNGETAVTLEKSVTLDNKDKNIPKMLVDELINGGFFKQLNLMLEQNMTKMQLEVADNLCKFLSLLLNQAILKMCMKENDVSSLLQKLKECNENLNENIKKSVNDLILRIKAEK